MPRIDFSTIALILALVVPGLIAQKSRRRLSPQSFETTGAAGELGAFVAYGFAAHAVSLLVAFAGVLGWEAVDHVSLSSFLQRADRFNISAWTASHSLESVALLALYICFSLAIAYLLGILAGLLNLHSPLLGLLDKVSAFTSISKRLGIFSLVEARPLAFELFSGESYARGTDLIFFLELQLREENGFVTGELVKYAIVKDEEPHRPVVLRDVFFKKTADEDYRPIKGDRLLIDLADALFVHVSYRDRADAIADLQPEESISSKPDDK